MCCVSKCHCVRTVYPMAGLEKIKKRNCNANAQPNQAKSTLFIVIKFIRCANMLISMFAILPPPNKLDTSSDSTLLTASPFTLSLHHSFLRLLADYGFTQSNPTGQIPAYYNWNRIIDNNTLFVEAKSNRFRWFRFRIRIQLDFAFVDFAEIFSRCEQSSKPNYTK